jgi:hypothetical protein
MFSAVNPSPSMMVSGCDLQKEVGDIVQIGENAGQDYEVVAIAGEDAWIRTTNPTGYGGQCILPLGRLRWIFRREELAA